MMKLPFLLASLILFFIVFPKQVVHAEEAAGTQSAVVSPTSAPDYTLPYPGILPDNPLYILKVFRDRLILFFISSPTKKSSFYLLQSDKRLEASWYLLKRDGKSDSLAVSTLSKSTNYLSQAFDSAMQAKKDGDDLSDLPTRLQSALVKHITVVGKMAQMPGVSQGSFEQEEKRLTDLQKSVEGFIQK